MNTFGKSILCCQAIVLFLILLPSVFSFTIEKCWLGSRVHYIDEDLKQSAIEGFVNVELDSNYSEDVFIARSMNFLGFISYRNGLITRIDTRFNLLGRIRVQRVVSYSYENYREKKVNKCIVSFSHDSDRRMALQRSAEKIIMEHAEECIRTALCELTPQFHNIGDNVLIMGDSRKRNITSQETINSIADQFLEMMVSGLVKAEKSVLLLPTIENHGSLFTISVGETKIDVLKYIERTGDLVFSYHQSRYSIETSFKVTGGNIELNDLQVQTFFGTIKGTVPIDTNGTTIRIKASIDYNLKPCSVIIEDLDPIFPPEAVNFSNLNIGFYLQTFKPTILSSVITVITHVIKSIPQQMNCEIYRDFVFGKTNVFPNFDSSLINFQAN